VDQNSWAFEQSLVGGLDRGLCFSLCPWLDADPNHRPCGLETPVLIKP
jgi:hypothetical protein